MTIRNESVHYCDFCGKSQVEVERIVTGSGVDICSECVEVAMAAILDERIAERAKKEAAV